MSLKGLLKSVKSIFTRTPKGIEQAIDQIKSQVDVEDAGCMSCRNEQKQKSDLLVSGKRATASSIHTEVVRRRGLEVKKSGVDQDAFSQPDTTPQDYAEPIAMSHAAPVCAYAVSSSQWSSAMSQANTVYDRSPSISSGRSTERTPSPVPSPKASQQTPPVGSVVFETPSAVVFKNQDEICERKCKSCESPADRDARVCEICGEYVSDSVRSHGAIHSNILSNPSPIKAASYSRGGSYTDPIMVSRSHRPPQGMADTRPKEVSCGSCGSVNDGIARSCNICGEDMSDSLPPFHSHGVVQSNILSHRSPIRAASYTRVGDYIDPVIFSRPHRPPQGIVNTRPQEIACGSCGSINDGGARSCNICGEWMRLEEAHAREQAFERGKYPVPEPFDKEKMKPIVWSLGQFDFKGPDGSRRKIVVPVPDKAEDGGWM